MKIVAVVGIALLTFGCANKKNAAQAENKNKNTIENPITALVKKYEGAKHIKGKGTIGQFAKETDPVMSIDTAFIFENTLVLHVRYGGGCEKHEFSVIGSEQIAKSYPPIRGIQLVHNANGDKCRAIEDAIVEIDISELAYKQEGGEQIYLALDRYENRLLYTYTKK